MLKVIETLESIQSNPLFIVVKSEAREEWKICPELCNFFLYS